MHTPLGQKRLDDSLEVVIFGSMSVGLERSDSDIDILCVGKDDYQLKSNGIDLIVISSESTNSPIWLESELASHIVEYGTWIKGSSRWKDDVHIGRRAIQNKRRRVAAFIKALADSWFRLDTGFRVKYSVKLRRETQRLLLLERGTPVPATKILDTFWNSVALSPDEVHDRLRGLTCSAPNSFAEDLIGRIDSFFHGTGGPSSRAQVTPWSAPPQARWKQR